MSVLVAYGIPPNKIKLFSHTGVNLHQTWQFEPKAFTGAVRENFERLLRTALLAFAGTESRTLRGPTTGLSPTSRHSAAC